MTLYRVSPTSPIAQALKRAAEPGKEVAVLVELQARFDEEANIRWARALETSAPTSSTGWPATRRTARLAWSCARKPTASADIATSRPATTTRARRGCTPTRAVHLPETLRRRPHRSVQHADGLHAPALDAAPADRADRASRGAAERLRREAEHARAGRPARVILKMNSLVDPALIVELYAASQAGVEIDLIVRGICCLRPGVPGISERIRVDLDRRPISRARARLLLRERRANPNTGWRRPTGCRATSTAAWRSRFRCSSHAAAQMREILEIQLADTVKAGCCSPTAAPARHTGNGQPPSLAGATLRADGRDLARLIAGHRGARSLTYLRSASASTRPLVTRGTLCWSPSLPADSIQR